MPTTALTDSQIATLSGLAITLSTFSFLCSLTLIACYLGFPKLRTFGFRMVCWISLADIFFSIGHMLGDLPATAPACKLQSYMIVYFELVSLFWSVAVARVLQKIILQGDKDVEKSERNMQMFCWGVPILMVLLPETTYSYGDSGPFCWIKGATAADQAWRFIVFYLWLWAGIGYVCWVYWKIHIQFRQLGDLDPNTAEGQEALAHKRTIERMQWYPLTLIICYFFASINRLYSLGTSNPDFTLLFLHTAFESIKGCANSVIYGYTGNAGSTLKRFLLQRAHGCGLCLNIRMDEEELMEGEESPGADEASATDTVPGQNGETQA